MVWSIRLSHFSHNVQEITFLIDLGMSILPAFSRTHTDLIKMQTGNH